MRPNTKNGCYVQRIKGKPAGICVTLRPAIVRYVTLPAGCTEEEAERVRVECAERKDRGDLDTKAMKTSAKLERIAASLADVDDSANDLAPGSAELPDGPGVYFVQMVIDGGADGPIKIGVSTSSMASRVAGLSGSMPWKLRVIGWAPGDRSDEQSLHVALRRHRMNGEWFRPDPFVVAIVAEVIRDGIVAAIRRRAGLDAKKVTKSQRSQEKAAYQAWLDSEPLRRIAPT